MEVTAIIVQVSYNVSLEDIESPFYTQMVAIVKDKV